jgi:hypothetical protein
MLEGAQKTKDNQPPSSTIIRRSSNSPLNTALPKETVAKCDTERQKQTYATN